MGDEVILKDDSYDELEGVFNKDSSIPGDELTGVIDPKGDDVDDDAAADADKGDEDTSDKGDAGEEDKKEDEAGDDAGDTSDASDDAGAVDTTLEDNEVDLRATLREQQRKLAFTEAKLDTLARQQKADKDAEASDDDADPETVAPSVIEDYQNMLNKLADTRGDVVADMLELMRVNPKYEDVESVCSKTNLDDTIETLARAQVAKEGGDLVEIIMGIEVDIWSQRNPYRYMYGLIKEIHPTYAKAEGDDKAGDDKGDTSKDKKKKTPAKAPLSALDLVRGGGDKSGGEWTAEKIDNLSESELNTVPDAVYKQYLSGDLDK